MTKMWLTRLGLTDSSGRNQLRILSYCSFQVVRYYC